MTCPLFVCSSVFYFGENNQHHTTRCKSEKYVQLKTTKIIILENAIFFHPSGLIVKIFVWKRVRFVSRILIKGPIINIHNTFVPVFMDFFNNVAL